MTFTLALAQCKHPADGDTIALVDRFAAEASLRKADLLVFPESLMTPYEKELGRFLKEAQEVTGQFVSAVDEIAKQYHLWIAYTMNEKNPEGNPFNTAIIVDPDGEIRFHYKKVHLFDSYQTKESDRMSCGNALESPIDMGFCRVGLGICYDLRFPEVARFASLNGAQLMLYPAAWVAGECKVEQWTTLLKARAIENEMFVAGLSRCDDGYIGSSMIVSPQGKILAAAGTDEELLVAEIDLSIVDAMRKAIPVFEHRRPELYR